MGTGIVHLAALKNWLRSNERIRRLYLTGRHGWWGAWLYALANKKHIRGSRNRLRRNGAILTKCEISIAGTDNVVDFGENGQFSGVTVMMFGSGHRLSFGPRSAVRNTTFWFEDKDCTISVGEGFLMFGGHIAVTEPSSRIDIGSGCLFSMDIDIRNGDSHSICDLATGDRINYAQDVRIGNRVWLGKGTVVLKGAQIGDDCIVGSCSVVTKSVPNNSAAAGNPARVIRGKVFWKPERIYSSTKSALPRIGA
jgi:acetyltransferase-like isoleucine patch superfamily enzyme